LSASKRKKQKRVLTYEEWERFIGNVTAEPQRTAIINCLCLGVRREEVWALKWSDFNFVAGTVRIQRTIIGGKVYERVKNDASEADLPLDESLIRLLLDWRSKSEFNKESDWVWASRFSAGEMRLYFNAIQRDYIIPASTTAGLRQDRLAHPAAHLSRLVERRWYAARSAEGSNASRQYRRDRERVRRRSC